MFFVYQDLLGFRGLFAAWSAVFYYFTLWCEDGLDQRIQEASARAELAAVVDTVRRTGMVALMSRRRR